MTGTERKELFSLPVQLSTHLTPHLHLLLHPTRTSGYPLPPEKAYFKSQSNVLELSIPLNVAHVTYDKEQGRKLAEPGIDVMGHYSISSSEVQQKSVYAAAIIKDGKLHLTPIKSVSQMRPTLNHIDRIDDNNKDDNEDEEEDDTPKIVNNMDGNEISQRPLSLKLKDINEEPSVQYQYFPSQSIESTTVMGKLVSKSDTLFHLKDNKQDYLNSISPTTYEKDQEYIPVKGNAGKISLQELQEMPLDEQIKALFLNANVLSFNKIKEIVTEKEDRHILRELERVAHLVQGVWVVRGDVKYKIESQIKVHTKLLHQFNQSHFVQRKQVIEHVNITNELAKEVFTNIARLRAGKGWELKVMQDDSFLSKHKEIVERQTKLLEEEFEKVLKNLTKPKTKKQSAVKSNPSSSEGQSNSLMEIDEPESENVQKIRRALLEHSICSHDYLLSISGLSDSQELKNLLSKLPIIHLPNRCVALLTIQDQSIDPYRSVILKLFTQKPQLKKGDIINEIETQLRVKFPQGIYQRVMKQIAVSNGSNWTLRQSPDASEVVTVLQEE
ncbi:hypothetical protein ROZALSC1DRAFT_27590 [Rozella allomycis CSF55]|uniref:DNA-directed RNA polymerase III subunit Rpc5 domain-containing protein n=1 Tax=Rozella allomycis (strain CSF55) TaxID=988480 RepID=A0A075ANX9_ROZAC|nr:DNA-directed RNA polymerase III subunit Rpc5 domain-containing protein [Rozella allomycis CSF55]RKP20978.1 hypothetical protein ROZALSC1DRAFT_27590 [Rozella allomycis CSF55]|eukprot:EPZ31604.1 DNA-directed RNA polymerase III subunit Rpc5 domain-containing protein [Rozella allomycis CSF55]